jgi:hypothetical protein
MRAFIGVGHGLLLSIIMKDKNKLPFYSKLFNHRGHKGHRVIRAQYGKELNPATPNRFPGVNPFFWLSELKFLCGLGDLCGKIVFKILVLSLYFLFWLNYFFYSWPLRTSRDNS